MERNTGTRDLTTAPAADAPVKKRGQLKLIWLRFRKNKRAMFGLYLMALIVLTILSTAVLIDYHQNVIKQNMSIKLAAPSAEHWFGTDQYGRDLFARIVFGGAVSLSIGFSTVMFSLVLGTVVGAIAGYFGGWIDNLLMRITDIFLSIPSLILAVAIVAALGSAPFNLFIAMGVSTTPRFVRIVRSAVLQIKDQEYIESARAYGSSHIRVIYRHIIPNAIGPIIVQATLNMAQAILTIASLGFVGLGIPSPMPEWGTILAENKGNMRYYPHLVIIPSLAIVIAVMSLNFIGDGLRDALDPRLKN